MSIDNLTLGELKQIAAMFGAKPAIDVKPSGDGRPVIVRSRDAGALFGNYAGNDGANVHLTNARQLWQWFAAKGGTLVDVAQHGVKADKCKFSPSQATVTVFNACAMIDCSPAAAKQLAEVEAGKWA